MEPRPSLIQDQDVYSLTQQGNAELHEAGTSLSPAELEILVLIDGHATVAQVVNSLPGMDPEVARGTLGKLLASGRIGLAREVHSDAIDATGLFGISVPAGVFGGATAEHRSEADTTVSSLKQKGYYVRIARRAAAERRPKAGGKYKVLIVEDDPDLAKMLRTYLALEEFVARVAASRDEIIAAFREPPVPDLVLLDVTLPDADGFDVLARMRQHPVLKGVPVIMLTAKATRESVLKGLLAGADGYVTKPFEVEALMQTVRAVLGLTGEAGGIHEVRPDLFGAEHNEMSADYRERLAARLQRIEHLLHELAAGTAPAGQLGELHRELHTVAGSADMFGLPAVAQAARAVEALLDPYRKEGTMPGPQAWAQLKEHVEALKRAAQPH